MPDEVVGRSLDEAEVGVLAGASGCADGFNDAIAKITKQTPGHDWKRRGERLVRASGLPYTVIRPGWFDYNAADQHRLVMLQGDNRWASDPSDGVIARAQIAQVLLASLTSGAADRKTLELVAEDGPPQTDPRRRTSTRSSQRCGQTQRARSMESLTATTCRSSTSRLRLSPS